VVKEEERLRKKTPVKEIQKNGSFKVALSFDTQQQKSACTQDIIQSTIFERKIFEFIGC
jgi:uncharacterized protein YggL (DUF469 family)